MSWVIGRLAIEDPTSFPESVGESVSRIGATPVPGGRQGLATAVGLESFTPVTTDTVADRQRVRRQLRAMLNNLPMRLTGLYVAWSEDDEQNGWYVPGKATFDVAGEAALISAFWRFTGLELALVGRRRTHRRGVQAYLRDRRLATTPRDFLRRIYSTDFVALSPIALTWLPSTVTDVMREAGLVTLSSTRGTFGSGSVQALVGASDLEVISFEQTEAVRNRGDVVIYDRRGTLTGPTTGPAAEWEEVYGPDWPLLQPTTDVPVLDNGIVRVRYDTANTDGFALDRWTGSAWSERAKLLIERIGDSTAFCDTLISASVVEWAPERAVVRCVMRPSSDALGREEIYITLQRGWTGPRVEVYPAVKSLGDISGAGLQLFRFDAPSGTETANKFDASLQTATGVPNFTPGALGAATFSGENWLLMRRSGVAALILAVLQSGAGGRIESSSSAYGATRNGIGVRHSSAGYISAHVGFNDRSDTTAIDAAAGTTFDGARDLGKEILMESRSPQIVVAR